MAYFRMESVDSCYRAPPRRAPKRGSQRASEDNAQYEAVCNLRNLAERDLQRSDRKGLTDIVLPEIIGFMDSRSLHVRQQVLYCLQHLTPHAQNPDPGIEALVKAYDRFRDFEPRKWDHCPSENYRPSTLQTRIESVIDLLGERAAPALRNLATSSEFAARKLGALSCPQPESNGSGRGWLADLPRGQPQHVECGAGI